MVAVAAIAVVVAITVGGCYVGAAIIARHRAQAVADLASLSAAAHLAAGIDAACGQAAAVARAMRARIVDCAVTGLDVLVSAEVPVAVGGWGAARAAARAGPVMTAR